MWITHARLPAFSTAFVFAVAVLFGGALRAQQSCSVNPFPGSPAGAHIFSVQQERALGDVEAEWLETNYPVVHDDGLASHLDTVAGRILGQFPPEQARVRVMLIDIPEVGSFSAGPERIYITRKMVAMLKNDDELAGLVGHEMGHILTHQNAIIVSELLHEILGVNAVSDRKDISDKLSQMLGSIDRDKKTFAKAVQIVQRREEIHQWDADRVALYTIAAAGFSARAFLDLFDRSTKTDGSTGNILGNSSGVTSSDKKRLREIHKTLRLLPRPCREVVPAPSPEFLTWRAAVLSYSELTPR
jgi:predicted Zn-dependent protease